MKTTVKNMNHENTTKPKTINMGKPYPKLNIFHLVTFLCFDVFILDKSINIGNAASLGS